MIRFIKSSFSNFEDQNDPSSGRELTLVVEARNDYWRLIIEGNDARHTRKWLSDAHEWGSESDIANHKNLVASRLWEGYPGWLRVSKEPCQKCGAHSALCVFCDDIARHFIDGFVTSKRSAARFAHLCDGHARPFLTLNELYDASKGGSIAVGGAEYEVEMVEMGMYVQTDGCICDQWE